MPTCRELNAPQRRLLFRDRPPLPYDVLSIGVGSAPLIPEAVKGSDAVVPIKPMQTFLSRLARRLASRANPQEAPRVVVVGGGAGGVEIAFCLPGQLGKTAGPAANASITLVHGGDAVPAGFHSRTQTLVHRELQRRGVHLELSQRAVAASADAVLLQDGRRLPADVIVWAGAATAPQVLAPMDFEKDERGFLLTRSTLQLASEDRIFAVGDAGTLQEHPTPKAGVFAVRQGPVLWKNIGRLLNQQPLTEYRPQRDFLKLLNTGDGKAIGEYRGFAVYSSWAWRLKDGIDASFMAKHTEYQPRMMSQQPAATEKAGDEASKMRCVGCGGKIGGSVLSSVLRRLEIPPSPRVPLGLDQPDDAAVIQASAGGELLATVDFFHAPVADSYLAGRLAALNAISDIHAMGGKCVAALAMTSVPHGPAKQQEQTLYEVMAGGVRELNQAGAALAGGHTIEGDRLMIGFTVLGDSGPQPFSKHGLRQGDDLILTKPLGAGVLLAAQMQAACTWRSWSQLMDSMLQGNQSAAELAQEFGVVALTDVTGFGLAGHLLEMCQASQLGASIWLDALPLFVGVRELIEQGVESTLAPANRAAEEAMRRSEQLRESAGYRVLFDPQTCGGLLMGVDPAQREKLLDRLRQNGHGQAAWIGCVDGNAVELSISSHQQKTILQADGAS